MDITPFTTELRESLRAAAAVGDDATKSAVTALTAALEPAARLALLSALSAMAKEVTTQLADSAHSDERITVSVGLDGRDVTITTHRTWAGSHSDGSGSFAHSFSASGSGSASSATSDSGWSGAGWAATGPASDDAAKAADGAARSFAEASGDLTRTTVRMFNELKGQAERAAAEQGVSLNSFISRAVADSIRGEKAARRGQRHGGGHGGHRADSTISGYVQG